MLWHSRPPYPIALISNHIPHLAGRMTLLLSQIQHKYSRELQLAKACNWICHNQLLQLPSQSQRVVLQINDLIATFNNQLNSGLHSVCDEVVNLNISFHLVVIAIWCIYCHFLHNSLIKGNFKFNSFGKWREADGWLIRVHEVCSSLCNDIIALSQLS